MITLTKIKNRSHEITNEKGVTTIAAASDNEVDGYSPVDYITSSVSICMGLTLDSIIKRDNLSVDSYVINVEATKAEGTPSRLEKIDVEVIFETELDEKVKEKLIKLAKRGCTIGNTIEHGAEVNVTAKSFQKS